MDLNENGLEETQRLVKDASESVKTVLHITNVAIASEVEAMVKACVSTFGRIDFAMNNAGIARGGARTTETTTDMYEAMANVNEKGVCQLPKLFQAYQLCETHTKSYRSFYARSSRSTKC